MILEKSGLARVLLICSPDKRCRVFLCGGHTFLHFHIQFHFNIKRRDEVREHIEESWLIENNDRVLFSRGYSAVVSSPPPPAEQRQRQRAAGPSASSKTHSSLLTPTCTHWHTHSEHCGRLQSDISG